MTNQELTKGDKLLIAMLLHDWSENDPERTAAVLSIAGKLRIFSDDLPPFSGTGLTHLEAHQFAQALYRGRDRGSDSLTVPLLAAKLGLFELWIECVRAEHLDNSLRPRRGEAQEFDRLLTGLANATAVEIRS